MARGAFVPLSFDELNALLVALQDRLGVPSAGTLTEEGRQFYQALHDRLERLQFWEEDGVPPAANDRIELVH